MYCTSPAMQKTSSSMNSTALGRPPISTFNKLAKWLTRSELCKISYPLCLSLRKIQCYRSTFVGVARLLFCIFPRLPGRTEKHSNKQTFCTSSDLLVKSRGNSPKILMVKQNGQAWSRFRTVYEI